MDRRTLLKTATLFLGASVSASTSRALLADVDLSGLPAVPVLDDVQRRQVAVIAELIIPTTDTPGAIAAGVPDFIHRIVADWYTHEERSIFLNGLADLDRDSRERFAAEFLALAPSQQLALLDELDAARWGGIDGDSPFFAKIKELTILGYYTSEIGSRHELVYRPVPGTYHGHAQLDAHSRQEAH
jgi:Gluconate 2-dehydrogenase subunit 3